MYYVRTKQNVMAIRPCRAPTVDSSDAHEPAAFSSQLVGHQQRRRALEAMLRLMLSTRPALSRRVRFSKTFVHDNLALGLGRPDGFLQRYASLEHSP
jgi:hypothetical protein